MELKNTFEVQAAPDRAWAFLLDPELVVPCMPGAELKEVVDDETWKAVAKVKAGPVTLSFKGTVTMQDRDDDAYRIVMLAKGTETRGKGMFKATITSHLEETNQGSRVVVVTDLKLSGKAATFSRGMVGDVSERLTEQFAKNMEGQLDAIAKIEAEDEPDSEPESDSEPEPESDSEPEPESDSEPEPESDSEPEPESDSEPEPESDSEPEPEPDFEPKPKKVTKLAKPPPPKTEAIGGVGLFFWALWRAIKRFFRRLFGGGGDEG